jgi:hypothetical protein
VFGGVEAHIGDRPRPGDILHSVQLRPARETEGAVAAVHRVAHPPPRFLRRQARDELRE